MTEMKTIRLGKPIDIDEGTARFLQLISEGKWDKIDRDALRSAIPDTSVFIVFLERHNLTHTAEAKAVLKRLGIAEPAKAPPPMAARAAKKMPRFRSAAKRPAPAGVKTAAAKKLRGAKRRKQAKSVHK